MSNFLTRDNLLSLASAPIIWGTHFLICYVVVSLACAYGFGYTHTIIAIATLLALALLGYTAWANYRKWRQARLENTPGHDIQGFFSLNAILLSGLSAVALIWVAFPAAVLPTCAA